MLISRSLDLLVPWTPDTGPSTRGPPTAPGTVDLGPASQALIRPGAGDQVGGHHSSGTLKRFLSTLFLENSCVPLTTMCAHPRIRNLTATFHSFEPSLRNILLLPLPLGLVVRAMQNQSPTLLLSQGCFGNGPASRPLVRKETGLHFWLSYFIAKGTHNS